MTRVAVTGATGHLGRLVVAHLLESGTAPADIVAIVRNADKASAFKDSGIDVRVADYTDAESYATALIGIDRLLLISSSEVGQRALHHGNVVSAALESKVPHIIYTGLLNSPTSTLQLAGEHQQTEQLIEASGMTYTFLRNGWYTENYVGSLPATIEHGLLLGAGGDAHFAPATRDDLAAAAAAVLVGSGHDNVAYELGGDDRITLAQLAAIIADISGEEVTYQNLSESDYAKVLVDAGLPEPYAAILADSDRGLAQGELDTQSGDLARLIGRPTQTVHSALIAPIAQLELELA